VLPPSFKLLTKSVPFRTKMPQSWVRDPEDWRAALEGLKQPDNPVRLITLPTSIDAAVTKCPDFVQILEEALSHPSCKVVRVAFRDEGQRCIHSRAVASVLVRVAALPGSTLTNLGVKMNANDQLAIQEALLSPSSFSSLWVCKGDSKTGLDDAFQSLSTILARADCSVQSLSLSGPMSEQELGELAKGLIAKTCPVSLIQCQSMTEPSVTVLLSSLRGSSVEHIGLQELKGSAEIWLAELAALVESPNNSLKAIQFDDVNITSGEQTMRLVASLSHPNCRVQELTMESFTTAFDHPWRQGTYHPGYIATMLQAASQPGNKLDLIELLTEHKILRILAELLTSPHCKLRTLIIRAAVERFGYSANSVYQLLSAARTSCLRTIEVTQLVLDDEEDEVKIEAFGEALSGEWFQVFITLLSVKHVLRLGRHSGVRILPIADLLDLIATTLDWPLKDLCL